ncbi:hypothetical protein CERZMDRAFT_97494 [Cercospora zeae-maydis SCOH1-5]|uniref:Uncharacterized protein n=1 Tax=Cercospora zeae-maydis SCOH1-5 TaxID=717836 RepID=A0A6A6FFQ7_9PEZI|nr:hypothetical protein CERZMDRAFT_97494 [Cercospora zeae-maydis SCOH1-5]
MFALPQATTSAVAAARDGEKSTPTKNSDNDRHSLYGSGGRPHPRTPTDMPPKTPQATPEGETAFSSTAGAASGTDGAARTWRDIHASGGSYQVSISAGSSSSSSAQRQAGGEGQVRGVKKKKSFMQALGLRSRKSSSALNRSVSAETWETTGTRDSTGSTDDAPPLPTSPAPTSSSTATRLLTRKRGKSSPKTPQEQILQGQDSMASFMSTDSVSSVATVSPFGRSPHLPTPLRVSTTTDDAANPPLDPREPFPGVVASGRAELPLRRLAPAAAPAPDKSKNKQQVSNFSSPTPAYYRERSERWLADRYPVDDDGREIASPIGPPVPEKRRMPDQQAMREAEEQAREWSRYVQSVKQEVQRQREREAQDPLGPAPHTGTSEEMDDYGARQQERMEDKVKLGKQFVDRTSTYGLMLKDGGQSNGPQGVSVYDVLADWEKNHAKGDPQMKETVIKRLFKRVRRQFSSPSLKPPLSTDPNTPIITEREVKKDEEEEQEDESRDDASDQPLASTPDDEHHQTKGLGIASPSTSSFDCIPPKHPARIAALEAKLAKEAEESARTDSSPALKAPLDADSSQSTTPTGPSSVRTVVPKGRSSKQSTPSRPLPGHRSDYIVSPTLPSVPVPNSLPHQEQSGWETDDEVDIDDDLMDTAKASGSTPDQRHKFRDEQEFSAMLDQFPAPTMFSSDLRAKLEKEGQLPPLQVSQVGRKNSTLVVKRDPSSRAFSPQLDTHEQQAEFDQNIQEAAQRRAQKLSKVPVSAHHPALRLDTGDEFAPRSSSLPMQMQVAKTRPSNIPTPTKAKPVKPAKPSKLAAHSTLRGVPEEEESPPLVRAQIPRPPKYGQHISPGKGLESPEAQNTKSPVEQHMDNVAAAWQGPRTPSLATKPNFDASPSMQEAQEMRRRFGLPLLEFKREGEPPHPNHRYAWDTQNLMCQGIHRGAYEPLDASPSFSSASEAASPLRRFGTSAVLPPPAASHDTFASVDINFEGKSCHHCHRTCCYYTEQLAVLNIGAARDEAVRVAVEKARGAESQLRTAFPAGVERFDAHMKCSECGVVCCHQHGVVCSTLSCRAALCERCARWLGGACRCHGGEKEKK